MKRSLMAVIRIKTGTLKDIQSQTDAWRRFNTGNLMGKLTDRKPPLTQPEVCGTFRTFTPGTQLTTDEDSFPSLFYALPIIESRE